MLAAIPLAGCLQPNIGTIPQPTGSVQTEKLISKSPNHENINANEEKISFLAARIGEISRETENLENRLDEIEALLNQENEEYTRKLQESINEINNRINQISEIQNKTVSVENEIIKGYQLLNQNFLTLQSNFFQLQKNQENFQNEIAKNLAETKLLALKEIERISNEKTQVFVEEITKQAETNAKQSELIIRMERKMDDMEKNISDTLDKKLAVILDELTQHESRINSIDKKITTENIRLSNRFDSEINKAFIDIDNQLKQKFSIIISELVNHESKIQNLDGRIKNLEKTINISSIVTTYPGKIEDIVYQEKEQIKKRYLKEIEERMQFYARIKEILEDIANNESQLAVYRAQIASLESVKVDTGITTPYSYIIVKPGDTLSKIAVRYNTNVALIKKLNQLKSDIIYAGQYLKIPAPGSR